MDSMGIVRDTVEPSLGRTFLESASNLNLGDSLIANRAQTPASRWSDMSVFGHCNPVYMPVGGTTRLGLRQSIWSNIAPKSVPGSAEGGGLEETCPAPFLSLSSDSLPPPQDQNQNAPLANDRLPGDRRSASLSALSIETAPTSSSAVTTPPRSDVLLCGSRQMSAFSFFFKYDKRTTRSPTPSCSRDCAGASNRTIFSSDEGRSWPANHTSRIAHWDGEVGKLDGTTEKAVTKRTADWLSMLDRNQSQMSSTQAAQCYSELWFQNSGSIIDSVRDKLQQQSVTPDDHGLSLPPGSHPNDVPLEAKDHAAHEQAEKKAHNNAATQTDDCLVDVCSDCEASESGQTSTPCSHVSRKWSMASHSEEESPRHMGLGSLYRPFLSPDNLQRAENPSTSASPRLPRISFIRRAGSRIRSSSTKWTTGTPSRQPSSAESISSRPKGSFTPPQLYALDFARVGNFDTHISTGDYDTDPAASTDRTKPARISRKPCMDDLRNAIPKRRRNQAAQPPQIEEESEAARPKKMSFTSRISQKLAATQLPSLPWSRRAVIMEDGEEGVETETEAVKEATRVQRTNAQRRGLRQFSSALFRKISATVARRRLPSNDTMIITALDQNDTNTTDPTSPEDSNDTPEIGDGAENGHCWASPSTSIRGEAATGGINVHRTISWHSRRKPSSPHAKETRCKHGRFAPSKGARAAEHAHPYRSALDGEGVDVEDDIDDSGRAGGDELRNTVAQRLSRMSEERVPSGGSFQQRQQLGRYIPAAMMK